MRKTILIILLLLLGGNSWASHIAGAEITYECIGKDSFYIELNVFRDCADQNSINILSFIEFSSDCGDRFEFMLPRMNGGPTEVSQLCANELVNSSCLGGPLPGMNQYTFRKLVVFPSHCNAWKMQWTVNARNVTVNLVDKPILTVVSELYNENAPCNTSPVFNGQPVLYVCEGEDVNYNFEVTEADGDSLVYNFVEPLCVDESTIEFIGRGEPYGVPFVPGYSGSEPISGIHLDSSTGQVEFKATISGNFALAIKVSEYDRETGKLKGSIVRDVEFVVRVCANKAPLPPSGISSVTGAGIAKGNELTLFCDESNFSFSIVYTDPDIDNIVTLEANIAEVIPGATYVTTPGNPAIITVSGRVTANTPVLSVFIVSAKDDACPIPSISNSLYKIIKSDIGIGATVAFETKEICDDGFDGHVSVSGIRGAQPYTYLWSANANNKTTDRVGNLLPNTDYKVTITDAGGCSFDTSITMPQVIDVLNVSTQVTNLMCAENNTGAIECVVLGGMAPYTYLWPTLTVGETNAVVRNLSAGSYQVVVSDAYGCESIVTSKISTPLKLEASELNNQSLKCFGDNDGEASIVVKGGTLPYQYLWPTSVGNSNKNLISDLTKGIYVATVTDANLCKDTAKIIITAPLLVEVSSIKDTIVCSQEDFVLKAQASGGNGAYVYNWNNGLDNLKSQITSTQNTNLYTDFALDANGCRSNLDTVNVTVSEFVLNNLNVSKDKNICFGESVDLLATYNGNWGDYEFQWSHGLGKGNGPLKVNPVTTEIYEVTLTDQCNNQLIDQVTINVLETPKAIIPNVFAEGCGPLNVDFKDQAIDLNTYTYEWDFGDGLTSSIENPMHEYKNEGVYVVSVIKTSNNGCVGDPARGNVTVYPSVTAYGEPDKYITDITNPTIKFTNLSTGADITRWDFGLADFTNEKNTSYKYMEIGNFPVLLSVSNKYGCHDEYNFDVNVINSTNLVVPDVFIPNPNESNGGLYSASSLSNEVFYPRLNYLDKFKMLIYNRWGELIFETNDINIGWDGYYQGKLSPQDMYIWKIDAVFEDGHEISEAGSLTLLR